VWLAGPPGFAALYDAELPQKDGLCGPFWLSLALRASGVLAGDGIELGQDAVAVAAGSKLAKGDPSRWLPPRETSRADYHLDLPVVDEDASGTSVAGLVRAADQLGRDALAIVAIAGPWDEEAVGALFETAAVDRTALLLANVQTGAFVGSHASFRQLTEAAQGNASELPGSDWDVGHFVNPMLYLEGPHSALVLIRDTYPSLGADGHHWQTAGSLAAALARNDGRQGGVLVLCSPVARSSIEATAATAGLRVEIWDNGTPT
jgi:hypothetical protein